MFNSIIVAIDESDFGSFKNILDALDNTQCMIKIGSVAFNSIGQDAILYAAERGFDIFLDLKFHDIPNTVYKSINSLINLPIKMLTIHTSGGIEMMQSAMKAVQDTEIKVFGVTALTSLSEEDIYKVFNNNTLDQVNKMLNLAEEAGIDGVVCSPHELKLLNQNHSLLTITPGIRVLDSNDDQRRVMTPKEAIELGANYIVIGRAITLSDNIKNSLNDIYSEIYN